jgi:hypothetical protein
MGSNSIEKERQKVSSSSHQDLHLSSSAPHQHSRTATLQGCPCTIYRGGNIRKTTYCLLTLPVLHNLHISSVALMVFCRFRIKKAKATQFTHNPIKFEVRGEFLPNRTKPVDHTYMNQIKPEWKGKGLENPSQYKITWRVR